MLNHINKILTSFNPNGRAVFTQIFQPMLKRYKKILNKSLTPVRILTVILNHDTPERLDKGLLPLFQELCPELTRNRFQDLIRQKSLLHNDHIVQKSNIKATQGIYKLTLDDPKPSHIIPKDIALDILYEDDDVLVINKQADLTVHPGAGTEDDTLVNGLLHHFGDSLSGIGGVQRPGIVHRLDKNTTGLMVIAKNDYAHQKLSEQFADRSLSHTYIAFVFGIPVPREGRIDKPIGRHPTHRQKMTVVKEPYGKNAITLYKTLQSWVVDEKKNLSYAKVRCTLLTGRTHQIRVHMQSIGHPLIGDPLYGKKTLSQSWPEVILHFPRQALNATEIRFIHPRSGETLTFTAPLPSDMSILQMHNE